MSTLTERGAGEPTSTIGLVAHPRKSVLDSVRVITTFARTHRTAVIARAADAERVGSGVTLFGAKEFVDRVDAIVSLGGDGTMLGAMRLVVDRGVPVLGVNHGNVGFLVEVAPAELEAALTRLVEGRFDGLQLCGRRAGRLTVFAVRGAHPGGADVGHQPVGCPRR
jgi:NAD+ kinase